MVSDTFDELCRRFPEHSRTAFHEAGHAVAALAFGRIVAAMSLDRSRDQFGAVWLAPLAPNRPSVVRESLVVSAAGPVAAARYTGGDVKLEETDDLQVMVTDSRRLVGLIDETDRGQQERALAILRAQRLIDQRWAEVQLLAESLLRHHVAMMLATPPFAVSLESLDTIERAESHVGNDKTVCDRSSRTPRRTRARRR